MALLMASLVVLTPTPPGFAPDQIPPRTPNPAPVTVEVDPVCEAFGSYCGEAKAVMDCESGGSTTAVNGQYLGAFQMGDTERATYGHGPTLLEQARAAFRYFAATGFTWGPWSCKP